MSTSRDKIMPVIHKKTGNLYFVMANIINCTNAANDEAMVLYINTDGMIFCREKEEFWEKFEVVQNTIS